jgi:enoyl-[acyl-carrier protein] reductase I
MGLFEGKKGVVVGIANDRSIAWSITECLHEEGAVMGFTHLPDRDPERRKNEKKVRKLVEPIGAKFVMPCDVCDDEALDAVFETAKKELGEIDFLVHSVAFAPPADLTGPTYNASREGYKLAMEISAYSLHAMAKRAREIMPNGGSILALTYYGGEEVIPGYNLMGICKAALECGVKYLASEMGSENIRVNAISAGPIRTISSSGVGDFKKMLDYYEMAAPLRRNTDAAEVGKSAKFLLSDLASGVTGEILHVDCGFNVMGAPPAVV